jgi:L-ascorbate metabolism protein UlaG (beta-lactamase superfamily)
MENTLTFIGTATTLLRVGGFTVLTDPNFLHRGQRAYLGRGLWSKRRTEPYLQPAQLPALDAVLLSHLHGDHFDRVARRELDHALPVITTAHASRRLRRHGFEAAQPLEPWEERVLRRADTALRITAVPGDHAPTHAARLLLPPVMGSVLELRREGSSALRVYVTGDTLFRPAIAEQVADRFPDLDAVVIHLGGTRILGLLVTMDGRQGADLIDALSPALTVPVHHDDYPVFRSPLSDFLGELGRRGRDHRVCVVARGETVVLDRANGASGTADIPGDNRGRRP